MSVHLVVECWARCHRCHEVFIVRSNVIRSQREAVRRASHERNRLKREHRCPPNSELVARIRDDLCVPADVRIVR